jgi:hypothetical protein
MVFRLSDPTYAWTGRCSATDTTSFHSQPHEVVEASVRASSPHATMGAPAHHATMGAPAPHACRASSHAAAVRGSSSHPRDRHVVQQLLEPTPRHMIVLLL